MPDILALPFNETDIQGFRDQLSSGCVCSFCQINRRWLATYDGMRPKPHTVLDFVAPPGAVEPRDHLCTVCGNAYMAHAHS